MRHLLAVVLLFTLLPGCGLAQERWLQGTVFTLGDHDEKLPAVGVIVTAQGLGNPVKTTAEGSFRLTLSGEFQAGTLVTLQVEKPGWRIQLPPEGKTRLPADLRKDGVEVLLLPVDSKLFWTPARLANFINDLSEKSTQQLTPDNKPVDFSRAIKDWAVKYGFSAEHAKAEIDRWIAEVQATHDDPFTLGLAAFAEKNFRKASALFHEAATQDERKLAELKQAEAALVDNIVRAFRREGDAHANSYLFDEALAAYQQALRHVTKAQQPHLWAAILHDIAGAHYERGLRVHGPAIRAALAEAVAAYRLALEVRTRAALPQDWATTHNGLGNALQEQGIRTAGEPGTRLLVEAVAAYRLALEVRTRAALPQDWATTHNGLGNALQEQGIRTAGEPGTRLLAEAVAAYRLALEVRTRAALPQDWATTHNGLGNALQEQGIRTAGEPGTRLLVEAVAAYRLALEVRTRASLPQDWATAHNGLGNALQKQGIRTAGEPGTRLLVEAVAAYRLALEVRTRAALPQDWATTHNNLGNALQEQGIRTAGEPGTRLLAEAVAAYRLALEVFSPIYNSQQWAMTHNNLGNALQEQGKHTGGEPGTRLLAEAVAAYRLALKVRTRAALPQQWATTHNNLGETLQEQGIRTGGEPGTRLLAEAVAAYRLALEVFSPIYNSQHWGIVQNNLARVYQALRDWPQAITSSMNALSVDPDAEEAYQTASFLSHDVLFDFPQAFALNQQWLDRHPDDLSARSGFAEKHLTTGRFAESTQRLAALLAHPDIEPAVQVALRTLDIVNLLALHQAAVVPDRLDAMLHTIATQADDFQVSWGFGGTLHFIGQHAPLAPYGAWLQQLISALSATDRQAMLTAVQAARASFAEVGK